MQCVFNLEILFLIKNVLYINIFFFKEEGVGDPVADYWPWLGNGHSMITDLTPCMTDDEDDYKYINSS